MLPQVARAELGIEPVHGPFSHYLNADETAVLIALVRSVTPAVMIEFGISTGRTACRVLDNVPSITTYIGVDVRPDFRTNLACQRSEVPRLAGIEAAARYQDRFWLRTCQSGSCELEAADLEPADAIFVDGDHSEAGVTCDALLSRRLIRPGGIVIFHDYQNPGVEVTRALDRLYANDWPLTHVQGTWLAYARF